MRIARCLAMVLGAASLACSSTAPTPVDDRITGTVTYRERIALPPDAVVKVELRDVSMQDVPSILFGETTITRPGQVPIPFEVLYEPLDIDSRRTYATRARITVGNDLWFINTTRYAVITHGNASHVDMVLQHVR